MKNTIAIILLLFTKSILSQFTSVEFTIQTPSSIAGLYLSTNTGDPTGSSIPGWTSTPDMTNPANAVQGILMMVEDGTPGTNPQGNPISQEGCNPLINDLTGKIAVIWRNTCQFGEKILNAQNAGAIGAIIINREPGLVNMAPADSGYLCTIPAVFIDNNDGITIVNEMANGTVVGQIGAYNHSVTIIPDDFFEQALEYHGLGDGIINDTVYTHYLQNIDTVDYNFLNIIGNYNLISNLTGIEDFSSLEYLSLLYQGGVQISNLDVSQNTALEYLVCESHQLTNLDVSQNTALEFLYCGSNQLTNLDVSQNTALENLYCWGNQLTNLDVSQNTSLIELSCSNNQISSLDLSGCASLSSVYCNSNNLTCLNLKNGSNYAITNFNATNNDSLNCIEVDNVTWSTANWTSSQWINVQSYFSFSNNCLGCGCNSIIYFSDTLFSNVSDLQFQNASPQIFLVSSDTFPQVNNPNCDSVVSTFRQFNFNPNYYSDTLITQVFDTLLTYDTLTTYDTLLAYDTIYVDIFDTTYISISVTDTLYIDITVTGVPGVDNTISVYPNPANDVVTIDNGNYSAMSNYSLVIINSLSQQVFSSQINTQQIQIPVSTLGAEGTYFIQILDGNNNLVTTKYLVLN